MGVNLRDPGLNVADINNYHLPKSYKNLFKDQHQQQKQQQQQQQQQHAAAAAQPEPRPLPLGFVYTGLPVFQAPKADAWDAPSPPSAAEVAEAESAAIQRQLVDEVRRTAAEVERAKRAQRVHNDAGIAHRVLCAQAAGRDDARRSADEALRRMSLSRAQVESLWRAFREADREGSGRLTAAELSRAFDRAGARQSQQLMAALAAGLRDNVGLVPYRELSKVLLAKSKAPLGADLRLFGTAIAPRKPPVPSRPSTAIARSDSGDSRSAASAGGSGSRPSSAAPQRTGEAPRPSTPPPPAAAAGGIDAPPEAASIAAPQQQPAAVQTVIWADSPPSAQQQQQLGQGSSSWPEGFKFHPYKSQAYWFSSQSPDEQRKSAAEWKAANDSTHRLTTYHIGEQIAAAKEAASHETRTIAPETFISPVAAPADQQQQQQRQRPSSAGARTPQNPVVIPAATGSSVGSTLKGASRPLSAAGRSSGSVAATYSSRPMSARPIAAHVAPSFSSIAQSQGGPKMAVVNTQIMRHDIIAVRALY